MVVPMEPALTLYHVPHGKCFLWKEPHTLLNLSCQWRVIYFLKHIAPSSVLTEVTCRNPTDVREVTFQWEQDYSYQHIHVKAFGKMVLMGRKILFLCDDFQNAFTSMSMYAKGSCRKLAPV